jgi:predicted AAA+ superfamily ATPase
MGKIIPRFLDLEMPSGQSAFLWGPRQVGKSFWIQRALPDAELIDLLKSDVYSEYAARPALLRERLGGRSPGLVVIDEIQKIPALLDEVHWLIENQGTAFLMTGSSARKLRRGHANLLAGRAWTRRMVPLAWREVPELNLERVMLTGLLPRIFLSSSPREELRAYVGDYLKEEIAAEGLTRNIPAFSEFLRVAAITSSELLNYTNVGREAGVSAKVVRGYFDILEDTYLGFRVSPWRGSRRRRLVETEKFYLFDVGVANHLARREPRTGSAEFGKSFEHFVLMELMAYRAYQQPDLEIRFWRTAHGQEVDFIVGEMELAIEIKASSRVHDGDVRGLRVLSEESNPRCRIVVCMEDEPRTVAGSIEILPWREFFRRLWEGELLV